MLNSSKSSGYGLLLLAAAIGGGVTLAVAADRGPSTRDSIGRVTVRTYDAGDRLIAVTDPDGNTIYVRQDLTGRPGLSRQSTTLPAGSGAKSPSPITIHVPQDQPTIQAAIKAASNGDIVLVADGTYHENINFLGKAITVKSVDGASKTTIDGGGTNTVVTFSSSEGAGSILEGFTVTNGYNEYSGSGIYIAGAAPTIRNNIIAKNAGCAGIGIAVQGGGPLIAGNVIRNNFMSGCSGGTGGGGIGVVAPPSSGQTRIIGNLIENNNASSSNGGGGISLFAAGSPIVENNIIEGNNGGDAGGGLAMWNDSSPVIVQNLFFQNTSSQGGAMYWVIPVSSPGLVLVNNTMANNSSGNGSAIFDGGFDTNMQIENDLIIGGAGQVAYFCQQFNGGTTPAVFSHNDVFSAGTAAISGNCTVSTGRDSNVSVDPLFISAATNFHVQSGSPVIDAGYNSAPDLPQRDLVGSPRIENGVVDMGAVEFFPTTASSAPSQLTFAPQLVGTASKAQPVVLKNTGSLPLFFAIRVSGDFHQTNSCPVRLGPLGSCTINVDFKPTAKGTRVGALSFSSNAADGSLSVALSGTGE